MISVSHLNVEFSARPLFSDATFVINDKEHVALTGKNGAGKSPASAVLMLPDLASAGLSPVDEGGQI